MSPSGGGSREHRVEALCRATRNRVYDEFSESNGRVRGVGSCPYELGATWAWRPGVRERDCGEGAPDRGTVLVSTTTGRASACSDPRASTVLGRPACPPWSGRTLVAAKADRCLAEAAPLAAATRWGGASAGLASARAAWHGPFVFERRGPGPRGSGIHGEVAKRLGSGLQNRHTSVRIRSSPPVGARGAREASRGRTVVRSAPHAVDGSR